jgi:hypothetical protein
MSEGLAALKAAQREDERRRNRERMPNLAALMDDWREQFPDAKLIWGEDLETGVSVGTKPVDENVFVIPKDYFPMQTFEPKKGKAKR